MITKVYSVGLYCPYEGGTPSFYFNDKKDAEFMLDLLKRYSTFVDKHIAAYNYEAVKPVFELEKEFKDYFGLKWCSFPWKIETSDSKFELVEHNVLELDPASSDIIARLNNLCRVVA